jgi:transcriptional regulator with XRE-family HTH domain
MIDIGAKIKHFRDIKGYSQEHMATKLGMSLKTYNNLENEKTKIDTKKIQQIAQILEVNWLELLTFGEKITQINTHLTAGDNNTNSNNPTIYANLTDKDLIHIIDKSKQEVSFLKEKITSLQTENENLKEINSLLREKTK